MRGLNCTTSFCSQNASVLNKFAMFNRKPLISANDYYLFAETQTATIWWFMLLVMLCNPAELDLVFQCFVVCLCVSWEPLQDTNAINIIASVAFRLMNVACISVTVRLIVYSSMSVLLEVPAPVFLFLPSQNTASTGYLFIACTDVSHATFSVLIAFHSKSFCDWSISTMR